MNDYKKDFEFRQRCGILASRICTLADKYSLKMITPDQFTKDASELIEKEFGSLHAEIERLQQTQRKLAQIVRDLARTLKCVVDSIKNKQMPSADHQVDLAFRLGQAMEMFNSDPLVAAAIKEASDGKV